MAKIKKELFEFASGDELNNADKIKTRSLSYIQDALIRFKKNKLNVIATYILATLIIMSFLVPMISSKPYSSDIESHNDANLKFLTPRIQFLEKFGIFDGTKAYEGVPLDLETGNPIGISEELIKGDMNEYEVTCNSSIIECSGGTIVYNYSSEDINEFGFAIKTIETVDFSKYDEVVVDVESISDDITIQLFKNDLAQENLLGTEDATTIDISSMNEMNSFGFAVKSSKTNKGQTVKINSIEFKGSAESLVFEGSELMRYIEPVTDVATEGGKMEYLSYDDNVYTDAIISRENSEMKVADFRLDLYKQAFTDTEMNLSQEELVELEVLTNGDVCEYEVKVVDGNNVRVYEEGCTVKEAVEVSCIVVPGGDSACVYNAKVDYLRYKGYDELPYFWFGTDARGHDLFTKIFKGLNSSLLFGLLAAGINIMIGVVYGAVSGYYGGKTDLTLQRITEFVGGVPFIVALTLANLYFGQGLHTVAIVVCLTGWIGISKMTRAQFYRYKGREYVLASRSLGASDKRLIFRHILPNGIGIIVTTGVLMIPGMITLEATLSYLGLGLSGDFSLGLILSNGQAVGVSQFPHLTLFPTLIVCLLMITFNLFGMALRDALNPSLRGND